MRREHTGLDSDDHVRRGGVLRAEDGEPVDRVPGFHELEPPDTVSAGGHFVLAKALREMLETEGVSPIAAADGALWRYTPYSGIWGQVTPDEECQAACCLDGSRVKCGKDKDGVEKTRRLTVSDGTVKGTVKLLKTLHGVSCPEHFKRARIGVQFSDGFFALEGGVCEFESSSPDNRARHAYPWKCGEGGLGAPRFMDALAQWFAGDDDGAEKVKALQQFTGLALLGIATKYQKCLILKDSGQGNSGKSTFAKIINAAMPPGSVCSIPMQDFNEQNRAMLVGKLLNLVMELPTKDITESEHFKAGVTGDLMQGKTVYAPPFNFWPIAAMLFNTNGLPSVRDITDAFFRRFIIIAFNNEFGFWPSGDEDARHLQMERGLEEHIIADELPGVVAWAIDGAYEAMQAGRLTEPASHTEEMQLWRRAANIVASWVYECTRPADGLGDALMPLFDHFNIWRKSNKYGRLGRRTFSQRLGQLVGRPTKSSEMRYPIRIRQGDAACPF